MRHYVQRICAASKPATVLLLFHKAVCIRLYCDIDTQLLALNPGGLMRPGYAYTEMCQRALQQGLPQANVVFPKVRQAVWPIETCQAICSSSSALCRAEAATWLHAGQLQLPWCMHRLYVCLLTFCMNSCPQFDISNAKRSANCIQVEAAIGAALFACKNLHGATAGQQVG